MIVVDRSKVKAEWRQSPYKKGLEEFLMKVAMLKPLAKFAVSDKGIETKRHKCNCDDVFDEFHSFYFDKCFVCCSGDGFNSIPQFV